MAILKGVLLYQGSFKSIRHYRNLHSPHIFAGEKGGATREQILHHSAFARVRENIAETRGCGAVVKNLRRSLMELLPEQADPLFTGRLMRLVRRVMKADPTGERGRRAVRFSLHRDLLSLVQLNTLATNRSELLQGCYLAAHPPTRSEAMLHISGLQVSPPDTPPGATAFRLLHLVSLLSDWEWDGGKERLWPVSPLSGLSHWVYSGFVPVGQPLTADLSIPILSGSDLPAACTVIQWLSLQFYQHAADGRYLPLKGGGVKVVGVF